MEDYAYSDNPVIFWDLFGEQGHPIRTTITEMGPLLLARLLDLNDTQEGVLQIVFRYADENGLLLLDFGDLQSMLQWAHENAAELSGVYGNVSKQSVGAIQRQLLASKRKGRTFLWRARAGDRRFPEGRRSGARLYQRAGRGPADAQPQAVCDVPAVAAGRTVREPARGGRSGKADSGFLL
jgi:DNA helicase HerA-like ATPase